MDKRPGLAFFLSITLLLAVPFIQAQEMSNSIEVGNVAAPAGSINVSVPVLMSNNETIAGFQFTMNYSTSFLILKDVTATGRMPNVTIIFSNQPPLAEIAALDANGVSPGNGTIMNIIFDVNASAAPGTYLLVISGFLATNFAASLISFNETDGVFNVTQDNDGDGFGLPQDCNDGNSTVYPGAAEEWGTGVDSNCDSLSCVMKTDYNASAGCSATTFIANNDSDLASYAIDYGFDGSNYKNLKINYNVNMTNIDVHSPCTITLKDGIVLNAQNVCVDGRNGVNDNGGYEIRASRAAILSQLGDADLGSGSVVNVTEIRVEGLKTAKIGSSSDGYVKKLTIISTGDAGTSTAIIKEGSIISADNVTIQAAKDAVVGIGTILNAKKLVLISTGNFSTSDALVKQNAEIKAEDIYMSSSRQTKLGVSTEINATGSVTLVSTGTATGSEASVEKSSSVLAGAMNMTSGNKASIGIGVYVNVTGNFHMQGTQCSVAGSAVIDASSTTGNCLP